jgi:hypothetical protein
MTPFVYGQENSPESKTEVIELDSEINEALQRYTETDFIKMQEHYKQDSEVIEMMKLRSMAGNENANIFLEFLELPYEQAQLKHGTDVVASVIYTYYESTSLLSRFKELNNELDTAIETRNSKVVRTQLSSEEYFELAQLIWDEFVPKAGQAAVISGELLRAVEKLRDEAQRNANVNFHDGCHSKLIGYLRSKLNDANLFDLPLIKTINADLDRLEMSDQPYTDDDVYDRLSNRVVDWFLRYGGAEAHKKDPELQC